MKEYDNEDKNKYLDQAIKGLDEEEKAYDEA